MGKCIRGKAAMAFQNTRFLAMNREEASSKRLGPKGDVGTCFMTFVAN